MGIMVGGTIIPMKDCWYKGAKLHVAQGGGRV